MQVLQESFRFPWLLGLTPEPQQSVGSKPYPLQTMTPAHRAVAPAALQWQDDGELMPDELFQLVQRLRSVEPGHTSNELWRLGHKYPQRRRSTPVGQGQLQHHQAHQR